MSAHTPGPWVANGFAGGYVVLARVGLGAAVSVDRSMSGAIPPEDDIPNARLIAAAPDLLDALREALVYIEACEIRDLTPSTAGEGFKQARAAIAKAEGR